MQWCWCVQGAGILATLASSAAGDGSSAVTLEPASATLGRDTARATCPGHGRTPAIVSVTLCLSPVVQIVMS